MKKTIDASGTPPTTDLDRWLRALELGVVDHLPTSEEIAAFFAGQAISQADPDDGSTWLLNPHPCGTPEWKAWSRGWWHDLEPAQVDRHLATLVRECGHDLDRELARKRAAVGALENAERLNLSAAIDNLKRVTAELETELERQQLAARQA